MGLVGLIRFLKGHCFAIMHILIGCGIGLFLSTGKVSRWCACLWLYSRVVRLVCFLKGILSRWCACLGCTTHQLTLDLLLYGRTYLSRVHTTVQFMTMFKGTQTCCSKSVCSTYPWSCIVWAHISVALSYHSAMHDNVQGDVKKASFHALFLHEWWSDRSLLMSA